MEGSRELTEGWGESNSGGVQGADWRLGWSLTVEGSRELTEGWGGV